MSKSDVGELCCKVLGIYCIITALVLTQYPISLLQSTFSQRMSPIAWTASFVPSVLLLIFGALLWKGAKRLRLISSPDCEPTAGASGIAPAILQSIAFSALGIFILIEAISQIPNIVTQLMFPPQRLWAWCNLGSSLIKLAFGLWLLFGAEGLRKIRVLLLDRVRPAFHKDW